MRVLLINRGGLGDVLQMLPAIEEGCKILRSLVVDCIVDERWSEIPSWHPKIDRVLTLPFSQWRSKRSSFQASPRIKLLKRQIRKQSYDAVLDLSGSWLSAWLSRHCESTNFGLVSGEESRFHYSLFYRQRIPMVENTHQVDQWRRLMSSALGYCSSQVLGDYGLPLQRLRCPSRVGQDLVLLFSSQYQERQYPAHLARALLGALSRQGYSIKLAWRDPKSRFFAKTLVEGVADDKHTNNIENNDNIEVLPALKLSGLMAVLAEAKAVITVDNGLSHLAAAADVPTVNLVGAHSDPKHLAYGRNQVVVSSRSNLEDISLDQVNDALSGLLAPCEPKPIDACLA